MDATPTGLRRSVTIGLGVIVVLLVVLGVGPALAGGQSAPNSYYGTAETDTGAPVPEGTVIVAVADQEVQDTITVDPAGQYGGSGGFENKLRVSSEYDLVTFHIDNKTGKQAAETDDPEAETEQLDLTFPGGSTPGTTPTDTPTATVTATETPTQTTTETATETATATEKPEPAQPTTETAPERETPAQAATDTSVASTTQTAEATATVTTATGQLDTETEGTTELTDSTPVATASADTQFTVMNATLGSASITATDTVTVTATVTNNGTANGSFRAGLSVNNTVIDTETTTVPTGASRTIQFEYQPSTAGTYAVAVNNTQAGTLTVSEDESFLSGLPRLILLFVVLPAVSIYGVLKALAIYLGY